MNSVARTALVAITVTMLPAAWSADHRSLPEAQQRYRQERAVCLSGQSHQDRATCLKEAAAAYAEARRGHLGNGGNFAQNATGRCDAQPEGERQACIQRILGAGSSEGSVEGGGMLRRSESTSQ